MCYVVPVAALPVGLARVVRSGGVSMQHSRCPKAQCTLHARSMQHVDVPVCYQQPACSLQLRVNVRICMFVYTDVHVSHSFVYPDIGRPWDARFRNFRLSIKKHVYVMQSSYYLDLCFNPNLGFSLCREMFLFDCAILAPAQTLLQLSTGCFKVFTRFDM